MELAPCGLPMSWFFLAGLGRLTCCFGLRHVPKMFAFVCFCEVFLLQKKLFKGPSCLFIWFSLCDVWPISGLACRMMILSSLVCCWFVYRSKQTFESPHAAKAFQPSAAAVPTDEDCFKNRVLYIGVIDGFPSALQYIWLLLFGNHCHVYNVWENVLQAAAEASIAAVPQEVAATAEASRFSHFGCA